MNTTTNVRAGWQRPDHSNAINMTTHRKTALWADVRRAIFHGWKRFISILIICALGVTIFLGLTALAEDLSSSADDYYKQQGLYDLAVTAPGGLNQEDVKRLGNIQGVGAIEGALEQNFDTTVAGSRKHLTVSTLTPQGINKPHHVAGVMPDSDDQIAVNESYLKDSGKKVGDTVQPSSLFSNADAEHGSLLFKDHTYTIVAQVNDAKNIYNPDFATGTTSTQADYTFFVPRSAAVKADMYSSAYMKLAGSDDLSSYGQEYKNQLSQTKKAIERSDGPANTIARQAATALTTTERNTKWVVSDRTVLQSYNQIDTQVSFLKLFGITFPLLFLLVAVLISLTSMTRMVEEDRHLIGTYKALGYRKREILLKYLVFAGLSAAIGSILGFFMGIVGIPSLAFPLLRQMYVIPTYSLSINGLLAVAGIAIFMVTIVGAAWGTCARELREGPAALMRPQAPKSGSRIMLQRFGIIWNHLSFLNKVTARNLFRYKTRALMSIFGVLGCTALMMVSFTLRDTMLSLPDRQYDRIYSYDAMAITSPSLDKQAAHKLTDNINVSEIKSVMAKAVTLSALENDTTGSDDDSPSNQTKSGMSQLALQLMVVPDMQSLNEYIRLEQPKNKQTTLSLPDSGALLTVNAAKLLKLQAGSKCWIEDELHQGHSIDISNVVSNYAGNSIYMTQSAYETTFGDNAATSQQNDNQSPANRTPTDEQQSSGEPPVNPEFKTNAYLIKIKGDDARRKIAVAHDLEQDETFLSVVSNQQLKEDFDSNYATVNDVVGLLIVMAALLAFVVLFTLSTTNISERERELATIKVLGFKRREVHSYINKETLTLTIIGILIGLPTGWSLTYPMIGMMKMPGVQLEVSSAPVSWLIVGVLSLIFALAVMVITNRSLDRINMVESLKSPE